MGAWHLSDTGGRCVHEFLPGQCGICAGDGPKTANVGTTRRRGDTGGLTKQEICDQISGALNVARHRHAAGGTEPSAFWHDVAQAMGISGSGSKTAIARRVAESQGEPWPQDGDSTDQASGGGDTVTAAGLLAVRRAVSRFVAS